jgi:hypothetical protein
MNMKLYERPTTRVVYLQHQCHILALSGSLGASRNGYGDAEEDTWE